jgi:hypothetical protein
MTTLRSPLVVFLWALNDRASPTTRAHAEVSPGSVNQPQIRHKATEGRSGTAGAILIGALAARSFVLPTSLPISANQLPEPDPLSW